MFVPLYSEVGDLFDLFSCLQISYFLFYPDALLQRDCPLFLFLSDYPLDLGITLSLPLYSRPFKIVMSICFTPVPLFV